MPCGSRRNRGRTNRANAESPCPEVFCKIDGGIVRSEDDGHDLRIAPCSVKAVPSQFFPKESAQLNQTITFAVCFHGQIHSSGNLRSEIRRQACVVNEGARAID